MIGENMQKFIISVEATADLSPELLAQYNIKCVDMHYYVNDVEYTSSDTSMDNKTFYKNMKEGAKTTTSQVNNFQAKEYLSKLLQEGKDILHLSFTSALSGTYSNLKATAEELNKDSKNKIVVIDSLCASAGQGLLAILASEKADEFNTIDELANYIESIKMNISQLFIVDNLKYLAKSGRVSKVTAAIGSVLQIKPVLHVDNDGKLTSMAKVISRKKSIITLAEKVASFKNDISNHILITHADCIDEAKILQNAIQEKLNITAQILDLGCVIGSHAGPGTLAVFFTGNQR